MQKDFDKWNSLKKNINLLEKNQNFFYKEREVWWCSLGLNVGFEQDGKGNNFSRPILILKGFSKEVFLCIPLTTKNKEGKYYSNISLGDNIARKVILSQIKLVDSKRLQNKITTINEVEFKEIKQKVIQIIG